MTDQDPNGPAFAEMSRRDVLRWAKDPWDEPYEDLVRPVAEFNTTIYDRL